MSIFMVRYLYCWLGFTALGAVITYLFHLSSWAALGTGVASGIIGFIVAAVLNARDFN